MRRLLTITVLMTLGWVGSAAASTVSATLTPDTVSSAATASVAIAGVTGFSTLPSSLEVLLQRGFASSARSVSALCTATQSSGSSCPTASQVGTGSVGISLFGSPATVPVTLFLGEPLEPGDIASVVMSGMFAGSRLTVSGRLFVPPQRGLELLFSPFPSVPVTLDSLSLSFGASHTVTRTVHKIVFVGTGRHRHKKRVKRRVKTVYSLITTPSSCSRTWTGTATLTYTTGSISLPISVPCTT